MKLFHLLMVLLITVLSAAEVSDYASDFLPPVLVASSTAPINSTTSPVSSARAATPHLDANVDFANLMMEHRISLSKDYQFQNEKTQAWRLNHALYDIYRLFSRVINDLTSSRADFEISPAPQTASVFLTDLMSQMTPGQSVLLMVRNKHRTMKQTYGSDKLVTETESNLRDVDELYFKYMMREVDFEEAIKSYSEPDLSIDHMQAGPDPQEELSDIEKMTRLLVTMQEEHLQMMSHSSAAYHATKEIQQKLLKMLDESELALQECRIKANSFFTWI